MLEAPILILTKGHTIMETVERNKDFNQVCIWQGTSVGKENIEDLINWVQNEFKTRIQYLEEYETNPTPGEAGTGGRNDVVIAVHKDDIGKFAIPRLRVGIRWIEDVLDNAERNNELEIYPDYLKEYRTW